MSGDGTPAAETIETLDPRQVETLRAIMRALRDPRTGCPWDVEQTFSSIAPYTIEEAYEVADAIQRGDLAALKDELGDLLLQVVFHSQMAAEAGRFAFDDVVEAICRKMIRRHPHVFGTTGEGTAHAAKSRWEDMKAAERREGGGKTLSDVPIALPGLTRALKLQAKAARVGFDWPSADAVVDKMIEEAKELKDASDDTKAEEFGDLLFAMVNLGRHLGIDAEDALRAANAKFERRFAHVEAGLEARGKVPAQSTLEEMDELWNEAKRGEAK